MNAEELKKIQSIDIRNVELDMLSERFRKMSECANVIQCRLSTLATLTQAFKSMDESYPNYAKLDSIIRSLKSGIEYQTNQFYYYLNQK